MPLPPTRAVFLLSDAKLRQGGLQKSDRLGENGFFILVAVEQKIMDFCVDWGTGVLQIICQKIVGGNVKSVGDHDYHFKARTLFPCFNVANMPF